MKRSTNFSGYTTKDRRRAGHDMHSIASWLGMSDDDIRAMAERMQHARRRAAWLARQRKAQMLAARYGLSRGGH